MSLAVAIVAVAVAVAAAAAAAAAAVVTVVVCRECMCLDGYIDRSKDEGSFSYMRSELRPEAPQSPRSTTITTPPPPPPFLLFFIRN